MSTPTPPPASPSDLDAIEIPPEIEPPRVIQREIAHGEHRALGWAALTAVGLIGWMMKPVGVGILLGALAAFTTQPLRERLRARLGGRGSALVTVLGSSVVFAGVLGALGWLFVTKGTTLIKQGVAALDPGGSGGSILERIGHFTERFGFSQADLEAQLRSYAETALSSVQSVATEIAATVASALLGLFFMVLSMHFTLRNWDSLTARAEDLFPLRPAYTKALLHEFREVGRSTLAGTLLTGVAQGILATIGFWVTGTPEPIFFGAATAVASLVPAVGTMLVWVPTGIVLILTGHPTGGVAELVWGGVAVVAIPDYVIRPRLVSEDQIPSLVTFAALFGGVEVFGLKGLILGPVLMSLAIAVLRLYTNESRRRRAVVEAM